MEVTLLRESIFRHVRMPKRGLVIPAVAGVLVGAATGIFLLATVGTKSPGVPHKEVTAQDVRLLYQAEQILIRDCMAQHGFRYWVIPFSDQTADGPQFPFVIDNVAWTRRHGFGISQSASVLSPDPNTAYFERLPVGRQDHYVADVDGPEGSQAVQVMMPADYVLGHSSHGCQAWAEGKLYGNYELWFAAVNVTDSLQPLAQAQVLKDPRYLRAVTQWARCMRATGYPYSSPAAAAAAFRESSKSRPRQAGIRAAVAEANCANSTGLAATARRLDTTYADVLGKKYRQEVEACGQLRLDAVPIARAVATSGK